MAGSLRRIGKVGNQKIFFVFLRISRPVEFPGVVFALASKQEQARASKQESKSKQERESSRARSRASEQARDQEQEREREQARASKRERASEQESKQASKRESARKNPRRNLRGLSSFKLLRSSANGCKQTTQTESNQVTSRSAYARGLYILPNHRSESTAPKPATQPLQTSRSIK